jgi:long-chain acyl-CoA synthetase
MRRRRRQEGGHVSGNLAEIIATTAGRSPGKPALIDGGRTITYGELDAAVSRLATALGSRAGEPKERIGILLPNSIEFAIAFFGVLRAGLVALPLSTAYTAPELAHQVTDAGARMVITDEAHAERLSGVEVVLAADDWSGLLADVVSDADADAAAADVDAEALAVLLYTSGTSGRPKGAMLSHRALLANLEQVAAIDPPIVSEDDVSLLVLPLFHVYGLNTGLCLTLRTGATGVLGRDFDPVATLRLVREQGVTTLVGAPPMFVAWAMLPALAESLRPLRLAVSGAAALSPGVQAEILAASGRPIYQGYGLTETAPVLTTTLVSPVPKPGSIGRPIPGVSLKLLDETGDEVEEDDPGEIAVCGDNLFSGYWPQGADGPDAAGWWRTGDIAYADADGDLFLVDRARDLIIVSGFNVYPREVEDAIGQHPDVAEVAVIAVPHPYTGETVKALVVPVAGASPTPAEIIDFAAQRLARFKCPTTVEIVAELPHSLTGKVAKGRLRESG